MDVYANFDSIESSVDGEATVNFKWDMRNVLIINDSGSKELSFKFNSAERFATLSPKQTISLKITTREVLLSTKGSVPYRIWATG